MQFVLILFPFFSTLVVALTKTDSLSGQDFPSRYPATYSGLYQSRLGFPRQMSGLPSFPSIPYVTLPQRIGGRPLYLGNPPIYAAVASSYTASNYSDYRQAMFFETATVLTNRASTEDNDTDSDDADLDENEVDVGSSSKAESNEMVERCPTCAKPETRPNRTGSFFTALTAKSSSLSTTDSDDSVRVPEAEFADITAPKPAHLLDDPCTIVTLGETVHMKICKPQPAT